MRFFAVSIWKYANEGRVIYRIYANNLMFGFYTVNKYKDGQQRLRL